MGEVYFEVRHGMLCSWRLACDCRLAREWGYAAARRRFLSRGDRTTTMSQSRQYSTAPSRMMERAKYNKEHYFHTTPTLTHDCRTNTTTPTSKLDDLNAVCCTMKPLYYDCQRSFGLAPFHVGGTDQRVAVFSLGALGSMRICKPPRNAV
jgi:hypothetical protein